MSPITLEFQLDRDELLHVSRLAHPRGARAGQSLVRMGVATAALGVAFLFHARMSGSSDSFWPAACLTAAGMVMSLNPIWTAYTQYERQLGEAEGRLQPTRITISDGLHFEDHSVIVDYRWHAFTRVRESAAMFLLLRSPAQAVVIPKRALPEEASPEELRTLLESFIHPRQARFPVLPK